MRIVMALVLCIATIPALAADAPAKKTRPVGTWTKKVEERTLTFDIKADDTMTVTLTDGKGTVEIAVEYAVTRDSTTLFAIITGVKKTGTEGGPSEGEQFSFRFKTDKDTLTLSDLNGTNVNAEAKNLVEGEYKNSK